MEDREFQRLEQNDGGRKVILEFPKESCDVIKMKQEIKKILLNEISLKRRC